VSNRVRRINAARRDCARDFAARQIARENQQREREATDFGEDSSETLGLTDRMTRL
jgi:hypothetical protein